MADDNKRTVVKSVRMQPELVKKVEKMAEIENRTWANMIETLVMRAQPQKQWPVKP